jgi:DNA-binding NarL/FixJ family response regulator
LIADSDEALVSCVKALFEGAGYRIRTAATGEEAIEVAREEKPLVVLLEIDLPILNGYQVCRELRVEFGWTIAIAFVSETRTGPVDVSCGLLVGADDYIVKPFDSSELLARVGALMRRVAAIEREATMSTGNLTSREIEVLGLLSGGLSQREIAQSLSISPKTVAAHIEHILPKLGVHSRAEAVAAAYRQELIRTSR